MGESSDGESVPKTFDELARILHDRMPILTANQRRIATLILSDTEDCAFMTISELAKAAEVNESTIVRFATSFGLGGYPGLTALCREFVRRQLGHVSRFDAVNAATAHREPLFERLVSLDQGNVAKTFGRIDPAAWQDAVQALARADRVHVFGRRLTFGVASLFAYQLQLVRSEVTFLSTDGGTLMTNALRDIGPNDVLVVTGIHPILRVVVRAAQVAYARGAMVIALTDNAASPIAVGPHVFYIDTASFSLMRSTTAFTALLQGLAVATALELGPKAREALAQEEALLSEMGLYWSPEDNEAGE